MALHFLQLAYFISLRLDNNELCMLLSTKCLELLNINLTILVFRSLQSASSVLLLYCLRSEDYLFGDFDVSRAATHAHCARASSTWCRASTTLSSPTC